MSGRCSGHCCHSFSINLSPKMLMELAALPDDDERKDEDINLLASMLIHHGTFLTNPIAKTNGETWEEKAKKIARQGDPTLEARDRPVGHRIFASDNEKSHWYGCRHVQLNGDCGIYETRPGMCRRFPSGACDFDGCTMSKEAAAEHLQEHYPNSYHARKARGEIGDESMTLISVTQTLRKATPKVVEKKKKRKKGDVEQR